jgi:hypothetical protein
VKGTHESEASALVRHNKQLFRSARTSPDSYDRREMVKAVSSLEGGKEPLSEEGGVFHNTPAVLCPHLFLKERKVAAALQHTAATRPTRPSIDPHSCCGSNLSFTAWTALRVRRKWKNDKMKATDEGDSALHVSLAATGIVPCHRAYRALVAQSLLTHHVLVRRFLRRVIPVLPHSSCMRLLLLNRDDLSGGRATMTVDALESRVRVSLTLLNEVASAFLLVTLPPLLSTSRGTSLQQDTPSPLI